MSSVDFSTTSRAGYSYSKTGLYGPGYYKYNTITTTSTTGLPPQLIFAIIVVIIAFCFGVYVVFSKDSCRVWWNHAEGIYWCKPKTALATILSTPIIGITLLSIEKDVDEEKEKTKKKLLEIFGWIFMVPSIIAILVVLAMAVYAGIAIFIR